jgi:hypothetical protein
MRGSAKTTPNAPVLPEILSFALSLLKNNSSCVTRTRPRQPSTAVPDRGMIAVQVCKAISRNYVSLHQDKSV